MKTNIIWFILIFAIGISCTKTGIDNTNSNETESIENLRADPGFTFNTAKDVAVKFTTLDNRDNPVPGIRINVYTDYPDNGGNLVASFRTQNDGISTGTVSLPAYTDSLVIETAAIGFVNLQKRSISAQSLSCILGGSKPFEGGKGSYPANAVQGKNTAARPNAVAPIKALGTFDSNGVPKYLVSKNDAVDASLLADVNAALPEYEPVPKFHPQYLNQNNQTNLEIQLPSHVWVTFLHEGAGYRNVLCYYKYDVNKPPASEKDIDTLYAIFPNASYVNSGGGLVSGNKVEIGIFQPGTTIGWAIIANGYNGSAITGGSGVYYSNANLNPESNVDLKKHCILLNDVNREKFILSFEDLNREGGCDNDFNDAIFYVTADAIQSFKTANIALPAYTSTDNDRDGVMDNFDDYPKDGEKAFNNYYPSQNTVATLAFEDLWPSQGDYDFNDLVIDYNFNPITNSQNQVVQIKAAITVKAIGASYHNGFGIQLPVSPSLIAGVTGTDVRGSLIVKNPNGTEAKQSKATIIVFDDAYNELKWPGGKATGVNTTNGATYVQPRTLTLEINFTSPVSADALGLPPYNAFIFTDKNRSKEVHLVNHPPTDLADMSLLGTQHDKSNPAAGRYYVTDRNLPFAMNVFGQFDHATEKSRITEAYLKFYNWANLGGVQYPDWYKSSTGYRNNANIFSH
jgi:LruC domain-containing protein